MIFTITFTILFNMNIASYIFLGFFALSIAASFCVPVKLLKKISYCLVLPFLGGATLSILFKFLPDSYHSFIITILSLLLLTISTAIFIFTDRKYLNHIGMVCGIISPVPFITLYGTIFHIHHISSFFVILCLIFYAVILSLTIIFSKKQDSITDYVWIISAYLLEAFFNFLAFITLIYEPALYSAFLFAGTIINLGFVIFWSLNKKCLTLKHTELVYKILLITSQTFICLATILMLAQ